jgi:MFS family permease
MERRKLLFITQFVMMLFAFALAILVSAGETNIWLIYLVAFGRGVATAVNQPARQSLISELVPDEDLPNAVALNSATVNLTRVIGPAIGGGLIGTIGVAGAFYLNAFSFFAVLYCLYLMKFPAWKPLGEHRSMFRDLSDAYRYLRHEAGLRTLVILALLPTILGQPYQTMLTVFSKDVFHAGGGGLGIMTSMAALGAVIGALVVASVRQSKNFHKQMMAGLIMFGAMLIVFSLVPSLWLGVPVLLLVGFSNQTYQTSNNTLIQMNVEPEYRGRILSLLFLRRGLLPLGTVLSGALAAQFGAQFAVGSMAAALLLISVLATPYALPVIEELGYRMRKQDPNQVQAETQERLEPVEAEAAERELVEPGPDESEHAPVLPRATAKEPAQP